MSSIIDQLVDMGFARDRAEFAVNKGGCANVEQAINWIISNEGQQLPQVDESKAPAAAEGQATNPTDSGVPAGDDGSVSAEAASYKCNQCGKLFRDMNAVMFHAGKSGHEDFGESTEKIAELTPEQREKAAAELRERIKAARKQKAEAEKQEQLEKERRRREEGKLVAERREQNKEKEMRAIVDERKRQKQEDADAKKRILEQIRLDKEARIAAQQGIKAAPAAEPAPSQAAASAPKPASDTANIQIRLPSGESVRQTFGSREPLSVVRTWLQVNHVKDGSAFTLLVPFPRKLFGADDFEKPLLELGLVPSASLVMSK